MFNKKKHINFVDRLKKFPHHPFVRKKRTPTVLLIVRVVIYTVVVMLAVVFFVNLPNLILAGQIYEDAFVAKKQLEGSVRELEARNFKKAYLLAREGQGSMLRIRDYSKRIKPFPRLSSVEEGKVAMNNALDAGLITSKAIQNLIGIASEFSGLAEQSSHTLNTLSSRQKKDILTTLHGAAPRLQGIKADLSLASYSIDQIPKSKYLSFINFRLRELNIKIKEIQDVIDKTIPVCNSLPQVLGLADQQTYLFLLQNNTEIRPTGGFIGTYGIVKVRDGSVTEWQTDNVYNLDEPNKELMHIEPPWPLKEYNAVNDWFMRDANWSPDWPTSAAQIEWFYNKEGGPERNINGIIAIDPDFIKPLLSITGPIIIEGVEFNEKNFTGELEYQVEKGYMRRGIEAGQRKEIIGRLGTVLLEKIYEMPIKDWPELWQTVKTSIDEKHVLAFFKNDELQQEVISQNWAGQLKQVRHDYLMLVDANLASLKTDSVMERSIHYKVEENDNGDLIGKAIITYQNTGEFSWLTTRYRTYARLYVPHGSELIQVTGFMRDSRSATTREGVETTTEHGKTVLGAFVSVEPGELRQLIFEYKLPDYVKEQYRADAYKLLIQKQAGTKGHKLNLDFSLKKRVKSVNTDLPFHYRQPGEIVVEGDLRKDRIINLSLSD